MTEIIIVLDCAMMLLDCVTISDLRKFLLDFLKVKKSRKNAKRVYDSQSIREKIMLSFIKANLEKYIKEFTVYHKIYIVVLYTLIPQYITIIACNIFLGMKSVYALAFFAGTKMIINFILWINTDSNRVSRYRKR